jgi:hypothetical protein
LLLLPRFALAFARWLFCLLRFFGALRFFSVLLLMLLLLLRVRLGAWLLLLDLLDLLLLWLWLYALYVLRLSFLLTFLTFLPLLSLNRHRVLLYLLYMLLCMWLCNLALRSCLRIHIGIACLRPAILTNTLLPISFTTVYYARLRTLLHIGGLRLLLLLQHRLRHLVHHRRALC